MYFGTLFSPIYTRIWERIPYNSWLTRLCTRIVYVWTRCASIRVNYNHLHHFPTWPYHREISRINRFLFRWVPTIILGYFLMIKKQNVGKKQSEENENQGERGLWRRGKLINVTCSCAFLESFTTRLECRWPMRGWPVAQVAAIKSIICDW